MPIPASLHCRWLPAAAAPASLPTPLLPVIQTPPSRAAEIWINRSSLGNCLENPGHASSSLVLQDAVRQEQQNVVVIDRQKLEIAPVRAAHLLHFFDSVHNPSPILVLF
jgi:hypothetical protein